MDYSTTNYAHATEWSEASMAGLQEDIERKNSELRDYIMFLENYQVKVKESYDSPDIFMNIKENIGNGNSLIMKISNMLEQFRLLNLKNNVNRDFYDKVGNELKIKFDDYKEIYIDIVRRLQRRDSFTKANRISDVKHEFINMENRMSLAENCEDFSVCLYVGEQNFKAHIDSIQDNIMSGTRSHRSSIYKPVSSLKDLETKLLDETMAVTNDQHSVIHLDEKASDETRRVRFDRRLFYVLVCMLAAGVICLVLKFSPGNKFY